MDVTPLVRKFRYAGIDLPDLAPAESPEQIRQRYAATYPELATGTVEPLPAENGALIYEFRKSVGTKG